MENKKLQSCIDLFLKSQKFIEEVSLDAYRSGESVMDVLSYISKIGGEYDLSEMEVNGWECDILIPFKYNGLKYGIDYSAMYNKMRMYMED